MRRQAEQRRNDEMIELGKKNVECIKGVTNWCKHVRLEQVSQGLLAEMTGLPIGMIKVSCPHAAGGSSSMNLPWIVPEFILQNCVGCASHASNGDTTWATSIISSAKKQSEEREARNRERVLRIDQLRKKLQSIPRQARVAAPIPEQKILEFVEGIFDHDTDRRTNNLKQLTEAARIGPELFSSPVIDLLVEQASNEEFGSECLSVCAELALNRSDYSETFLKISFEAIKRKISPEIAAKIIVVLNGKIAIPLDTAIIDILINNQSYYRPIGGWREGAPEYPNSITVLSLYYHSAPKTVIEALTKRLEINNKRVRCDVCGAIAALREIHPNLGYVLLKELVESLKLDDDVYEESADGALCREIAASFQMEPIKTDEFLSSKIKQSKGEFQTLLISPYGLVLRETNKKVGKGDEKSALSELTDIVNLAFTRCFEYVRDDQLELKTRIKAAEALETASKFSPHTVLPHFDTLLGYVALLSLQNDPPKPPPQIIIPGEENKLKTQEEIGKWEIDSDWQRLNRLLTDVLEEFVEEYPTQTIASVVKCYETMETKSHERFKIVLLKLLGKIGKEYTCQPLVVPVVMKGLMDFDSVAIRANAIKAVEDVFRYSNSSPPSNILDVIVLYLRDPYVAVHKTAVRYIHWHAYLLNDTQKNEALPAVEAHAHCYRDKPYDAEEICGAAIAVSRDDHVLRKRALRVVKSFLPTGEHLVDKDLIAMLMRVIKQEDSEAVFVADSILTMLQADSRDTFNSYEHQYRADFFNWLHELSSNTYEAIKSNMVKTATSIAKRDPWEACYFVSIFSQYGDYTIEANILRLAAETVKGEKSYEQLGLILSDLQNAADANAAIQRGEQILASQHLGDIRVEKT